MAEQRRTSTSNFGVSRREAHDASQFYARFRAPEITDDDIVAAAPEVDDGCFEGDIRQRDDLPDRSVALVVTSPPYFAGKEYEEALGQGEIPASYGEFLAMLRDVFSVCVRKLEPGGRIAVNVANLGRKPYRSLSADVIGILQDDLGLLLRGEVLWQKGEGATGNCAWGSFRSAANPVLRDITERVVIASKGRFDRAKSTRQRAAEGFPHENTLTSDEFMSATLDVWHIEPESARRVNHPAPFPVQLPERLIHLYTFRGDIVLDPFMGSGSTLVAASRTGRRGVGYDTDPSYVATARQRIRQAADHQAQRPAPGDAPVGTLNVQTSDLDEADHFQARATKEGKASQAIASKVLEDAGFRITHRNSKLRGTGVLMNLIAVDADERPWYFDVTGAFTTTRGGLLRTDSVWKCLGRAHVVQNKVNAGQVENTPLVFLTSHLPKKGSEGDVALRAAGPDAFFDAVAMLSDDGRRRLAAYAGGGCLRPLPGFWSGRDIERLG
ncbi:MAG TPA: site-specific DNA-methyltransferase [Acidimicrobiales bacterium]|nr:site-specific DNA-methyltransferase [Acidimicrobiales bacterium]